MHLDDALARFDAQLLADGRAAATRAQYGRHLGTFARWLPPHLQLEQIGAETLARFLGDPAVLRRRDGNAKLPTSLNALRSSLRVFFAFCVQAGYLATDPARLVRRARCAPAPPRTIAPEDLRRLLDTVGSATDRHARRDFTMFCVLAATGIRLGSLIALDVGDVDLAAGELMLRATKGNTPQRVVMPPTLRDHLAEFIRGREHGPLFGRTLTARTVQRRLSYWCGRAGIVARVSPHTLRHSFAQSLYRHTGDILLVKEALGHASVNSTITYARTDRRKLRAAVESMPGATRGNPDCPANATGGTLAASPS